MQKGSVAIVGCGWLGFPLAQQLLESGYKVFGSTTSDDKLSKLLSAGIEAEVLQLPLTSLDDLRQNQPEFSRKLWTADQLVLTIPPGRGEMATKRYPAAVLSAVLAFRQNQPSGRIILTSSIGVYGKEHGLALFRETTPEIRTPTNRQASLLLAESQVQAQAQRPYRILRLGGLYGPGRDPKKWFAGREIPSPSAPANLVSQAQCLAEIQALLDEPFWSGKPLYNLVEENHKTRGEAYGV